MRFPDHVIALVQQRVEEMTHATPEETLTAVEPEIRGLADFDDLQSKLITSGILDLIYAARHQFTRRVKKDAGFFGGPPKVVRGTSREVQQTYARAYAIKIAGMTLGMLRGKDLLPLAESEERNAEGRLKNGKLLRALSSLVAADATVMESVKPAALWNLLSTVGIQVS